MSILSEINALVERLNLELAQIEQNATEGLNLARLILAVFPNNFIVIQLLAFLSASLFFVEISRKLIQQRVDYLFSDAEINSEELQTVGEELAMELGRALETKIKVIRIKHRLENLQ